VAAQMKRNTFWSWLWIVIGILYFVVPLVATFEFSLRAKKGTLSFLAYVNVFKDPAFWQTITFSVGGTYRLLDPFAVTAVACHGGIYHDVAVCHPGDCAGLWLDKCL
jgi:hypothetical protein